MAWLVLTMLNQTVKNGLKAKFSCTYWLISFCKIIKKFLELIQSYEDVAVLGPKWPICPEQIFFWYKSLLLISSAYWPFSLCKIWKILTRDPQLWGCTIFRPKMVYLPKITFFWKIINIILQLHEQRCNKWKRWD